MAETADGPTRLTGRASHPLAAMLLPVPIVCFIGALLTDLAYAGSGGNLIWVNFSSWLLAAGLLFGALAIILMMVDMARLGEIGSSQGWIAFALLAGAWVIELINALVHARDGWTAVVPLGLVLSAIGSLLILFAGWLWHQARYRGDRR